MIPRPTIDCEQSLPSAEAIVFDWNLKHPTETLRMDKARIVRRGRVTPPPFDYDYDRPSNLLPLLAGIVIGAVSALAYVWIFS